MERTYSVSKINPPKKEKDYLWLLPPVALYRGIKYACNAMFGKLMGDLVNFGQRTKFFGMDLKKNPQVVRLFDKYEETMKSFDPTLSYEKFTVKINEKTSLDSIQINCDKTGDKDKYMIVFMGRGGIYEGQIRALCNTAKTYKCNVIGFNYRGMSQSKGRAGKSDDLVEDGIAQVQSLIDRGVNPRNIVLYGECIGGAIATKTAEYFHNNNQSIYVFNDRSFSTLSGLLEGSVNLSYENRGKPTAGKILSKLSAPFVKTVLNLTNWEIDAAKSYKAIPEDFKDYIVVRSSKEERAKELMYDDGLIDHEASLHMALKPERKEAKAKLVNILKSIEEEKGKTIPVEKADRMEERILRQYLRFKEPKMDGSPNKDKESYNNLLRSHNLKKIGHFQPMQELRSRGSGITAEEYFKNFLARMDKNKYPNKGPEIKM